MSHINLLTKNIPYSGVRAYIQASQSSDINTYYVEGSGQRFYVNELGSSASAAMESASFVSFMSFTMSGAVTYSVTLIPMSPEETVMINTKVVALNSTGTKGYIADLFGGFRHSGSTLTAIGGSLERTQRTDFTNVSASFTQSATASVNLILVGQTSEIIDWDVHIQYTKGYHTLTTGTSSPTTPIYPKPDNPTS